MKPTFLHVSLNQYIGAILYPLLFLKVISIDFDLYIMYRDIAQIYRDIRFSSYRPAMSLTLYNTNYYCRKRLFNGVMELLLIHNSLCLLGNLVIFIFILFIQIFSPSNYKCFFFFSLNFLLYPLIAIKKTTKGLLK